MFNVHSALDTFELFKNAIQAVMQDEGFKVPSDEAAHALETARNLTKWTSDPTNIIPCLKFCDELCHNLQQCLPSFSLQANREKMWGKYHQLRSSEEFHKSWKTFFKTSLGDTSSNPILYQYITTYMFKELIKKQSPAPSLPDSPQSTKQLLTYEEKNALYYAAGYIPRALRKQLEHSEHELKEELILCLHELTEDDGIDDESQDWIKKIDRGGLRHVSFAMYSLIPAMELRL